MHGIVKTFPGVRALDGVDLDVRAGEVHCLLGQNGAGKSTLIKVLAGAHQPDAGTITWRGEQVVARRPAGRDAPGHRDDLPGARPGRRPDRGRQHLPGPRAARGSGITRPAAANRAAAELLTRLGHPEIRPGAEVGSLSAASQQMVSIARALSQDAQADHHGRAVRRARQRGGRAALRRHPRPHRARRRRRLHLPPARGDPPDRRPDHRPQGRPHRRHRPARPARPRPARSSR